MPKSRSSQNDQTAIRARLTEIAQQVLGLETLESRHSDRLDFHEFAVWRIEEALKAAYEAGRQAKK